MIPKGKLIIIGGHEEKGKEVKGESLKTHKKKNSHTHFKILGELILDIPCESHTIEIIASASTTPRFMQKLYVSSYKREGFKQVGFINVENKRDAKNLESIERIKKAHAVFFTGGRQSRLARILNGTKLLKAIKNKYYSDRDFIVGGTSAGAMAMSEIIIAHGVIGSALYKGQIETAKGFGLIKGIIVDTHFVKRGRFARLAHAVTLHPKCLGIGLEEDTALIISKGNKAECIGSGMVVIIDGKKIINTNVKRADKKTPVVVENLSISIVAEGSSYLMKQRRLLPKKKTSIKKILAKK